MRPAPARCDVFEFEECLLVVPRRDPRLFLLNPIARLIWEDIARGISPDETAVGLATRFAVPVARVREDVARMLAEWRTHGLLADAVDGFASDQADPPARRGGRPTRGRQFHAERVYALCQRPIGLRFETPAIEEAIHPPLANVAVQGIQPGDRIEVLQDGRGYLVVCNGADVEQAATLEDALGQVFGRILELSYPMVEWLALMHAAAVGDQRGAVVLAGDSGSGKSTLTAALVHAGMRYFSDDVVPLDEALRIRPLPLGISLKRGSWPVLRSRFPELAGLKVHRGVARRYLPVRADQFGPPAGLKVVCLVFPYHSQSGHTQVRKLSSLDVLQKLAGVRSWLSLDGRRFSVTLHWIERTPGYELRHASLEDGVRVIQELISQGVPPG